MAQVKLASFAMVAAGGLLAWGACAEESQGQLKAVYLRCEYRDHPLGVDAPNPRLSWEVVSNRRGERQTAWQIRVASSRELLDRGEADLWDSGRVEGNDTRDHRYQGRPLQSHQLCWWTVRVWDRDGHPGPWSEPSFWTVGILQPSEWVAQWIGWNASRPESKAADFGDAKWIVHAADPTPASKGTRCYVRTFELPQAPSEATLLITADDHANVWVNGERAGALPREVDGWKTARRLGVGHLLRAGQNRLAVQVENASDGPYGLLLRLQIRLPDGTAKEIVSDRQWKTGQPVRDWMKSDVGADWPAAAELGPHGIEPWGQIRTTPLLPPVRYLRNEFVAPRPVVRALLYTTALGIHDVWINGRAVHDEFFNPGWTDYRRRVYYRTYDVASLLRQGTNAIGIRLADGWYSGYVGYGGQRDHYGRHPRARAQLHLWFEDGSFAVVATGPDWRASTGSLYEADFLMGESCDARAEPLGWSEPGFRADSWSPVDIGAEVNPVVQWHPGPPVRVVGEFRPVKWTQPKPGVWVADLGQNIAGVVRLRIQGRPGQTIRLRHAERLNPDGTIYTANLRTARATDTYTCRGAGVEEWIPRLTFHGFQYVEVTGIESQPDDSLVTGLALSSDTPQVGEFDCSDPMLVRLWKNTLWTQRANFIDIPTDCPQRDERLGWTGDAQVYIGAACMNCDVQAFFTKWLVDLNDAQRADGQYPMVAPLKVAGDDGGPAWADAGIICPWTIWQVYGDRDVLERHYTNMVRFIEFCVNRSKPDLTPPEKFHCFGDWLHIQAETPKPVIYSAYLAFSTRLMAQVAQELGRAEDARKFEELYQRARKAFQNAYVQADGRIQGDTQTAYILALATDVLEPNQAQQAARYLAERIAERKYHLSTGFVGTRDIMHVLAKIGRYDLAFRLLHNDTFPSWGFTIRNGATTIWERWDSWTPERGFQDPGMNSFSHYAYGAVYEWMVQHIGGIQRAAPGYRKLRIAPVLDPWLEWARVRYDSPVGRIVSAWRRSPDGPARFELTIPANTTATVVLPVRGGSAALKESDQPVRAVPDVRVVSESADSVTLEVGSGNYVFTADQVVSPPKIESK